MRLDITDPAEADLDEIYDYYDIEASQDVAERYAQLFRDTFAGLLTMPYKGKPASKYGPDVREIQAQPYRVFYRVKSDSLQILHVFHSARNITPDDF